MRIVRVGANGWIAAFTIVLTAATILQAVVTKFQWDAMEAQNAQIIKSNQLVEGQLWEMQLQNLEMGAQRQEMAKQTKLAKDQLMQAEKAIGQTEAVIDQMRLENRPWLGVVQTSHQPFAEGKKIVVKVPIKNTGVTPAFMEGEATLLIGLTKGLEPEKAAKSVLDLRKVNVRRNAVPPDITMNIPVAVLPPFDGALTPEQLKSITDGDITLWIVGAITYRDTARVPHETRYCFVYEFPTNEFTAYPKYNYMD